MAEIPGFIPKDIALAHASERAQKPDALLIQRIIEERQLMADSESAYDPTVRMPQHEYCPQISTVELADPNVYD